jgi:hypothetical protein
MAAMAGSECGEYPAHEYRYGVQFAERSLAV